MVLILSAMLCAFAANAYPITYTSCGVDRTVSQSPQRIITLNQGATEFVLALGLASRTVGTAYLDDYIWPQYKTEYANIPVLSSSYPNETTIMSYSPDFINLDLVQEAYSIRLLLHALGLAQNGVQGCIPHVALSCIRSASARSFSKILVKIGIFVLEQSPNKLCMKKCGQWEGSSLSMLRLSSRT